MITRLQIRCLSQYCSVLSTKQGLKFLENAPAVLSSVREQQGSSTDISYWQNIATLSDRFRLKWSELKQLKMFLQAKDSELRELAECDNEKVEKELDDLSEELASAIVPRSQFDSLNKCQLEITSGVGGTEAMLFTGELVAMYEKLAAQNGWQWTPLQYESATLGGVRSAIVLLSGDNVYRSFRFEAGVHRVQRIPLTDKTRMHTSTACISILPEPETAEAYVTSKDVKIETMRASGPGGQNVNKRSTAVRMTHKATGIAVHVMDERFQHVNIQIAYRRIAAILMQQQQDAIYEKVSSSRKIQMGSRARAEKVRTYNFKDDRITDHRLRKTVTNVPDFMQAGSGLSDFIEDLNVMFQLEQLQEILENANKGQRLSECIASNIQ